MDSSIKQLDEIMSEISSSGMGCQKLSKLLNNFLIQREKEKLTLFPLGFDNGTQVNDHGNEDHDHEILNHENENEDHRNGSGDTENGSGNKSGETEMDSEELHRGGHFVKILSMGLYHYDYHLNRL